MKKQIVIFVFLIIMIFSVVGIYFNSSGYIRNQDWKYAEGSHIGDWLNKSNFSSADGLIYANRGTAKVILCLGKTLIIENTKTKKRGFYKNKS